MSVRKRTWKKGNGEKVEAWVVDYSDGEGRRRLKTFQRKSEAKAWAATTTVQIKDGTHVPDSATVTVAEAGKRWIEACQGRGLEPSTIDRHKQHLELHIKPLIGREKLSKVTVPFVRSFEDLLRKTPVQTKKGPRKRSADGVRRAVGALGALLSNAQEEGLVAVNAVHALRGRRSNGTGQDRHKRKLKVGVDIPTPDEVRRLLGAAEALKSAKAKGTLFDGWRHVPAGRHLRRIACIRTARLALGGCRPAKRTSCTSINAPTNTTQSAARSRRQASAQFPSPRTSCRSCANGS